MQTYFGYDILNNRNTTDICEEQDVSSFKLQAPWAEPKLLKYPGGNVGVFIGHNQLLEHQVI